MTVVYIDRVFLLNAAVDYLLMLCTAQLAGIGLHRVRLLLCAVLGGVYASLSFLPALSLMAHPLMKIAAGFLMALLAFGEQVRRWRLVGLFWLLSGGLAGVVLAVGLLLGQPDAVWQNVYRARIDWRVLLATTALFALGLHLLFRRSARLALAGGLLTVRVSVSGREIALRALRDTGNALRDPVRGLPVLVAEAKALGRLFDGETETILRAPTPAAEKLLALQKSPQARSFCLLPFQSVGETDGLLLAVRSDAVEVGKKRMPHVLVALSDRPVSPDGGYQALWGGEEDLREGMDHSAMACAGAAGTARRRPLHRRQRDAAPTPVPPGGGGAAGTAGGERSAGAADADRAESAAGGVHRAAV